MAEITRRDGDRYVELTINNPRVGNAFTDAMANTLAHHLLDAGETADLIVLRSAGDDFCVGRASMGQRVAELPEALARRRSSEVVFHCYEAFRSTPAPILGVVRGRAYGFGCAIASLCDITLAAETATFQIPEMAHNILPTMVMSALVDRLPPKELAYLTYTTAIFSAAAAKSYGLVSEVAPDGELDMRLEETIAATLRAPRPALLGVKEYLRSAPDMARRGAVDFARNLHATVNSSSEMKRQRQ